MAEKAPLQEALSNWQTRSQTYEQLGIPKEKYYGIAQQDLSNVANEGAYPMSTEEVNAAMLSQMAGKSIIGNPTTKGTGIASDVGKTISSVPSDIQGILTGFIPGIINEVHHLPSETTNTVKAFSNIGKGNENSAGGVLRALAGGSSAGSDDPNTLLSLVPGVSDAADLTTSAGRQNLMAHPVGAALDVAPLVGKLAGLAPAGEAGSALESMQEGNMGRAAARGLRQGAAKLPLLKGTKLTDAAFYKHVADESGMSQEFRQFLNRPFSVGARTIQRSLKDFVENTIGKSYMSLSSDARKIIYEANTQGGVHLEGGLLDAMRNLAPEEQAAVRQVIEASQTVRKMQTETKQDGLIDIPFGEHGKVTVPSDGPVAKAFENFKQSSDLMTQIKDALETEKAKLDTINDPVAKLAQSQKILDLARQLKQAQLIHDSLRNDLNSTIYDNPAASLHPLIKRNLKLAVSKFAKERTEKEIAKAKLDFRGGEIDANGLKAALSVAAKQLDSHLNSVDMVTSEDDLRAVAGDDVYQELRGQTVANVMDLVKHGYDPIWIKSVKPSKYLERQLSFAKPLPDHEKDITQFNEKTFNFEPVVEDVGIGLIAAARELFQAQATHEFVDQITTHWGIPKSQVITQVKELASKAGPGNLSKLAETGRNFLTEELNKYVEIDPARYGMKGFSNFSNVHEAIMIPKELADNLNRMMKRPGKLAEDRLPLFGAYDTALRVFRFSVLTGPRHLVHVGVAGLLPLMLEEPTAMLQLVKGWRGIRYLQSGGKAGIDAGLPVNLNMNIHGASTDQLFHYSAGSTLANVLKKSWEQSGARLEDKLGMLESHLSNTYRAAAYLSAAKRGLDVDKAIAIGNKVAVDMDDMSPLERSVIKQIFPFYGFTKFLFQYLLQYPVDHPYRTSIITHLAEQEETDWNSLLPKKFQMMLFLGKPNAEGNVDVVDWKNLNPFRSFSNDFTMAGFFQSLNPLLSVPFAARGFSTLSGVGSLYPTLGYNAQTGSLEAQAPSSTDQAMTALEQFVPEAGALDHFVGITDQMRVLKKTDPSEYRALLLSQLNIPLATYKINEPYVEEHNEINRYKASTAAVTQAEDGGGWNKVDSYQFVPYNGGYIRPEQLQAWWDAQQTAIERTGSTATPEALLQPAPEVKTSTNPLELLQQGSTQLNQQLT